MPEPLNWILWLSQIVAFVLETSGETIPLSGVFLTARENVGISHRRFVVSPLFFKSHSGSQTVSLYFQICSQSLILSRSSERRFTPAMKNHQLLVVLDYFSLRRLFL